MVVNVDIKPNNDKLHLIRGRPVLKDKINKINTSKSREDQNNKKMTTINTRRRVIRKEDDNNKMHPVQKTISTRRKVQHEESILQDSTRRKIGTRRNNVPKPDGKIKTKSPLKNVSLSPHGRPRKTNFSNESKVENKLVIKRKSALKNVSLSPRARPRKTNISNESKVENTLVTKRKSPSRNVSLSPRGRRKNVGVKINNISNESKIENDLVTNRKSPLRNISSPIHEKEEKINNKHEPKKDTELAVNKNGPSNNISSPPRGRFKKPEEKNDNVTNEPEKRTKLGQVIERKIVNQKSFRKKAAMNYVESSLSESDLNETNKSNIQNKVPIYKQIKADKKKRDAGNEDDPYAFDSDTEAKKIQRKRKLNDSSLYDKDMKEIMTDIEKKERFKKPAIYKKRTKKIVNKYDQNMDKIISNLVSKIHNKSNKVPSNETKKINVEHSKGVKNTNKLVQKTFVNINNQITADESTTTGESHKMPTQTEKNSDVSKNILVPDENITDSLIHDTVSSSNNYQENVSQDCDLSSIFGFEENPPSKQPILKNNPKIVVLDNVRLTNEDMLPHFINKRRPNANSTMCVSTSPWRFQSAWRPFTKDIIIDHSYDEKIKMRNSKSFTSSMAPVQTSILDYVTTNTSVSQKPKLETSLFDIHELSPVKITSNNRTPRKVLGLRNDIMNSVSTPIRDHHPSRISQPDLSLIEIMEESNKENSNCERSLSNSKENNDSDQTSSKIEKAAHGENNITFFGFTTDEDTALNTTAMRTYTKPVQTHNRVIINPIPTAEIESVPNNMDDLHFFEDIEPPQEDPVTPKRKRTNKKLVTSNSDSEDEFSPTRHRRKRKKPEEDPAYKKWVNEMNSTFAEIEDFELEVE